MAEPLDPATPAFAGRMFDLAREGATEELAALVDAGRWAPGGVLCAGSGPVTGFQVAHRLEPQLA